MGVAPKQDSTRYDKTQSLLAKYDPDYEPPTPRKASLGQLPFPRPSTPATPAAAPQVRPLQVCIAWDLRV